MRRSLGYRLGRIQRPTFDTVDLWALPMGRGGPEAQAAADQAAALGTDAREDLTRRYPHIYPPANAFEFERMSTSTSITAGSTATLISDVVPGSIRAVLRRFGNTTSDFANTSFILLINGVARTPFDQGITYEYGPLNQPTLLLVGVLLKTGDSFQVQATNTGAATVTGVRARLGGYFWPSVG